MVNLALAPTGYQKDWFKGRSVPLCKALHKYPKRVYTMDGFSVSQLNSRQKLFVAFGNVPETDFQFDVMPVRYQSFNPASDVRQIVGGVPKQPFISPRLNHAADIRS